MDGGRHKMKKRVSVNYLYDGSFLDCISLYFYTMFLAISYWHIQRYHGIWSHLTHLPQYILWQTRTYNMYLWVIAHWIWYILSRNFTLQYKRCYIAYCIFEQLTWKWKLPLNKSSTSFFFLAYYITGTYGWRIWRSTDTMENITLACVSITLIGTIFLSIRRLCSQPSRYLHWTVFAVMLPRGTQIYR